MENLDIEQMYDEIVSISKGIRWRGNDQPVSEALDRDLSIRRLADVINNVSGTNVSDEGELYHDRVYMVAIRDASPIRRPHRLYLEGVDMEDTENKVTYFVGRLSDEFLIHLFARTYRSGNLWSPRFVMRWEENEDESALDVMSLVRATAPWRIGLRIEFGDSGRALEDMRGVADSVLFHLAYNLDVSFVRERSLDAAVRRSRINRMRRNSWKELEPPRRKHKPDLVYHYQMGVATDTPALEYISYYHVAEHFFEAVFSEDTVARIQDKLTHPGFSYKRPKDVLELVKDIRDHTILRDGDLEPSEINALGLTLAKYVDVAELRASLEGLRDDLVRYYAEHDVEFSGGGRVDLRAAPDRKFFGRLANRIYRTRNAVVHSKDGSKQKYIPFMHDQQLAREIPLMRFVAEQIILRSATML